MGARIAAALAAAGFDRITTVCDGARRAPTLAHVRDALRAIRWWSWPEEEVRRISPLLCSEKVDDFLVYAQSRGEGATDGAKR